MVRRRVALRLGTGRPLKIANATGDLTGQPVSELL
jgi:hypothetical protein